MAWFIPLLKAVAVLAAAGFVGNWFLTELRRARAQKKPWYTPYLSIPGLMIIVAILLPVILKLIRD
jgi:hypothetical protein